MKKPAMLIFLILLPGARLGAAESEARADEEKAIQQTVESYVAAFNRADAAALAGCWSEDGVFVSRLSGQRISGRKAIEAEFKALFAEKQGVRLQVSVDSIRLITPNVAIEDGTATVTHPGESPSETAYMVVHVKRDGRWQMDSVRETVLPKAPSHYEHLKELEWLIGEWVDQDEESKIETVCGWTKNKNFITRSFTVSIKDRIEIAGTQIIGWDPVAGRIRSWIFDSDGTFGEGLWTRQGNRWTVKFSGVLQGGKKASSVNVLTCVDDNTFTWQSISREVDGELLPNIDAVTVVRKQSGN